MYDCLISEFFQSMVLYSVLHFVLLIKNFSFYRQECFPFLCVGAPFMSGVCGGQKGSIRSPRTRVVDSYELPCGYWEPNPGSLEEHP